ICAFRAYADDNMLVSHGGSVSLRSRPVHISIDAQGRHLLVAYHSPAGFSVHRLNDDGTIGKCVPQSADLEFGFYPHQILASPDGTVVILTTRGNDGKGNKPEEPGALKVFGYDNGRLSFRSNIAPNRGYG